jgi:uncharacterized protein (TIGR03435 family)
MKRQQAEAVLNRFLEECGDKVPAQSDVDPVLDRVWERLKWRADEFADVRMPAAPVRPFRFAWALGIVMAAILVNVLIWRQSSVAVRTGNAGELPFSKSSAEQAGETLQVTAPQDVFELASVKLVSPSSEAARTAVFGEEFNFRATGCSAGFIPMARVDPGRLTIPAVSLLALVIVAYGQDCTLVEGGPTWARSGEHYEINALLPAGTPTYKQYELQNGKAPKLQRMLQNLLSDRFRLVLRREFREMPVYALTVASPGKMKLSPDETRTASLSLPPGLAMPLPQLGRGEIFRSISPREVQLSSHAISLSDLAKDLRQHAGRIVVDKTGLNGVFDVDLKFALDPGPSPLPPPRQPQSIPPLPEPLPVSGPPLSVALGEQLGLKLESTRMPIEVLIIESVERPSEN